MKKNVGKLDGIIRYALGIALIILAIFFKWWLAIIGVILIATSAFGVCMFYTITGIDTTKKQNRDNDIKD
jgi:c-di-AMP phosphodiesterase-like protein